MRRRELIAGLGAAAAAWPVGARAQQKMPIIGFLHSGSAASYSDLLAAFRKGHGRLPLLAAELRRGVSVLVTPGSTPAALAAKAATSTIPIVFTTAADPEPNVEVRAIHPKAMPMIRRTAEEIDTWLTKPADEVLKLQRPLPDGNLRIVARGTKEDGEVV